MKKKIALIMILSTAFFSINKKKERNERRYLNHISSIQPTKLDGHEKSAFRDALMTLNPATGEIPVENIIEV